MNTEFRDILATPLSAVKGVGPKTAAHLAKKGLSTFEDVLYFLPRCYQDRTRLTPLGSVTPEVAVCVQVRVKNKTLIGRGRSLRLQLQVEDDSGTANAVWFYGAQYLIKEFEPGDSIYLFGAAKPFAGRLSFVHPDFAKKEGEGEEVPEKNSAFGRVVPVYSEVEGISQKVIRKIAGLVLQQSKAALHDPLPQHLRDRLQLPLLEESFEKLHFPSVPLEEGLLTPELKRVVFEEFFTLQLGLALRRRRNRSRDGLVIAAPALVGQFVRSLPFELTGDQKIAIGEITRDLASGNPMTRLVQGDVGAGKTVVALAAAMAAKGAGFQSVILAPTEVLAEQHVQTADRLCSALGLTVGRLTHSTSSDKALLAAIADGGCDCIIGTHAVFQKSVHYKNLGVVIIDEQHRFGVDQRQTLLQKNPRKQAHLMMMTATPIPRTLALTLYGDLDVTVLREKPPGRTPVTTEVMVSADSFRVYSRIRQTLGRGEQAFIIYPLVDESEKLDLKSATQMYEQLRKEVFPDFKLALLHGRMSAEEKDSVLTHFRNKKYQILVSTTVIEVGIDIPNATLMVIEHPERLGLSQLHQLRGRVGRGGKAGTCLLVAEKAAGVRLRIMERTDDGFEIAEEDLKLRGPGEFLGTRQSGMPGFRVAHPIHHSAIMQVAKTEVDGILSGDPELKLPENKGLKESLETRWKAKLARLWSQA